MAIGVKHNKRGLTSRGASRGRALLTFGSREKPYTCTANCRGITRADTCHQVEIPIRSYVNHKSKSNDYLVRRNRSFFVFMSCQGGGGEFKISGLDILGNEKNKKKAKKGV